MEEKLVRLSVRVPHKLSERVKNAAFKRRWSVNVYLEEALLEKVVIDEEFFAAKKK